MKKIIVILAFIVLFLIPLLSFSDALTGRACRFSGNDALSVECEADEYPFNVTAIRIRLDSVPDAAEKVTVKIISGRTEGFEQTVYLNIIPDTEADAGCITDTDEDKLFVNFTPKNLLLFAGDKVTVYIENVELVKWYDIIYYEVMPK